MAVCKLFDEWQSSSSSPSRLFWLGERLLLCSRGFSSPELIPRGDFPPFFEHTRGTHVVLVVGRIVFATAAASRVAEDRRRVVLQSVREPTQSDYFNDDEHQTTTADRHEGDKQKSRVGKVRGEIPAPGTWCAPQAQASVRRSGKRNT